MPGATQDAHRLTDAPAGRLQRIGLAAGPLAGLALTAGWRPSGVDAPVQVAVVAAIGVWMAVWWMTEAVPIAVTSLLPMVLLPLLAGPPFDLGRVAAAYGSWQVFLFFGGFLLAIAMEDVELHRRVALVTVGVVGTRPRRLVAGFMLASALLSMWISNTATALMMLPIGRAVIGRLRAPRAFGAALMLGIAYGSSIGGVATPIGTPPNIAFMGVYRATFPDAPPIGFATWMAFALPIVGIMLPLTWVVLVARVPSDGGDAQGLLRRELRDLGPLGSGELRVFLVFVATAMLWVFRSDIAVEGWVFPGWARLLPGAAINDGVVAMTAGLALFLIPRGDGAGPVLGWETVERRMPWGILLLFGGGFALADAIAGSGLSAWVGARMGDLAGLPPVLVIAAAATLLVVLTEVTSNTATAQVMLPLAAAVATGSLGLHPLLVMLPVTVAASFAFMLPVATPPNAVVFGSGAVRMQDMIRNGAWLNLLGVIVLTIVCSLLVPYLWDFALASPPPAWAR